MAGSTQIYPKSVFENQTNGTVFYREGKLNDPMMPNQAGVFESWRYSFDAGRQVFKANGTDKVYEKRLIKDKNGNPHWSDWMEISPGEAHGIQAIAINDRPLMLPNEDGAIKLMITPQMIDTYTKREIYDLVQSKIDEMYSESYIYVSWIDGEKTAKAVLDKTYPNGGVEGKFYLVEPKPEKGKVNNASYWIYEKTQATTAHDGYQFVEVGSTPNMKSFVSYSAFIEHTNDEEIHTTEAERKATAAAIAANKEEIEKHSVAIEDLAKEVADGFQKLHDQLEEHMNDVGEHTSPHLSVAERERLNEVFQNTKEMPKNANRYVVQGGQYALAYEQDQKSAETYTTKVKEVGSSSLKSGDYLIEHDDKLRVQFNTLTSANNVITAFYVELANASVFGSTYKWRLEADNGWTSEWIGQERTFASFQIPFNQIPETVYIKTNDPDATIAFGSITFYVSYVAKLAVDVGDPSKKLALNLVGPEDAVPTYNGKPLTELVPDTAETAKWGKITGDINLQTDLDKKIASAISKKINYADLKSHLRWDVYRDGVIRAICQQTDGTDEKTVEIAGENGPRRDGAILIDGIKEKLADLKEKGYVVYSSKLAIDNVSVFQDEDHEPRPVYFTTDNAAIPQSQQVIGPFVWDWPGDLFNEYDKIYIHGGAEYVTNARLIVKAVKYGDVEIGLFNETVNEYYNVTVHANELAEDVNEYIARVKKGDFIVEAAEGDVKLDAKTGTIIIGAVDYDYDASKDKGGIVKVYGQEVDERYAGRALFEKEIEDRKSEDEKYAQIAADATSALRGEMEKSFDEFRDDFDSFTEETSAKVESISSAQHALEEHVAQTNADLTAEAEAREGADAALTAVIDQTKAEIERISETYATKEELATSTKDDAEAFDLVLNDSAELLETIKDGTFEKSGRILFKRGTYTLSAQELGEHHIDFSEIRYIKGEEPVSVDLSNGPIPVTESYDGTIFEHINIDVGSGEEALSIVDGDERVKVIEDVAGKMEINLLPVYDRYELRLAGDAEVTFTGVQNRQYVVYVDQPLKKKKPFSFKVTNVSANNSAEFTTGLEHQKVGMRTILILRGDDNFTEDNIVVEEVAYGVANGYLAGQFVPVTFTGVQQLLYGETSVYDDCVENVETTYAEIGGTLVLEPWILDGWAHAEEGPDYVVRGSDGTKLGEGWCDEQTTFKIPMSFSATSIEVEFFVKPQLANIKLPDIYKPYFQNLEGFTKYQTHYQKACIKLEAREGYTLYAINHDQLWTDWQGTLPYEFTPIADEERIDYDLEINPRFYRAFTDFTIKVVEDGDFNKEKSFYCGKTSHFVIEPHYIKPADANFGVLYGAAPITFIKTENDIRGAVTFADEAQTLQEADIFVPTDPYANSYVDFSFAIAGPMTEHVVKRFFATVYGQSGEIVGDRILNRFAGDADAFFTFKHETKNAEDVPGVWTTSDPNIITVVDQTDDTVRLQVKKNGHVTLTFKTNNFGNTTFTEIEGRVNAYTVQCGNVTTTIDTTGVVPPLHFIGIDGKEVSPSLIYDTTGNYKTVGDAEYLRVVEDGQSIDILSKPLPVGESFVKEQYVYVSNYPETQKQEPIPGTATITARKYRLSIDWAKSQSIESLTLYTTNGVSNGNAFAVGGSTVSIIIKLRDGLKFKKEDVLRAAFAPAATTDSNENNEETDEQLFSVTDSRGGYFSCKAVMPYKQVAISL